MRFLGNVLPRNSHIFSIAASVVGLERDLFQLNNVNLHLEREAKTFSCSKLLKFILNDLVCRGTSMKSNLLFLFKNFYMHRIVSKRKKIVMYHWVIKDYYKISLCTLWLSLLSSLFSSISVTEEFTLIPSWFCVCNICEVSSKHVCWGIGFDLWCSFWEHLGAGISPFIFIGQR